jgi:diguanylate cyclase (GGDEF)-like protein/PAS domain S-box-containing protein
MNKEVLLSQGMPVARICQTDVVCCAPDDSLEYALQLMAERSIGSVLVCEGEEPVGILTRREAMASCLRRQADDVAPCLREVMSTRLLIVDCDTCIEEVGVELMRQHLRHAVVVDARGRLVGIASESDIVNNQGVEHDLFLRSVADIAPPVALRLNSEQFMRDAIEQMRTSHQSAALIRCQGRNCILTDTDVIRILASGEPLDRPLSSFALSELVSIDETLSLYIARKIFRRHGFRHLGLSDSEGRITRILSYSDILRSVERDYVARLRELLANRNEALMQSMHNLRLIERVINASMEGVVVTDATGAIQSVNPAFTAITGYRPEEVIGKNPNILSSGRHDRRFYDQMWNALRTKGEWQGEIWNRTKHGVVYPEWLSITAITDDKGNVTQYAAIFHDLTEMKRSEARIRQMAQFDDVTCLANRRLFMDRLEMAIHYAREQGQRFAVLALDLDMFKRINDRFGHDCGDEVLKTMAGRIEEALSGADTAARPGGDEFAVILSDIDDDSLNARIEHLARVISMPVLLEASEVRITASMGVAVYPEDADSVDGLLRSAEAALHQSKELGRNSCSYFSPELHQKRQSRYLIAAQLHDALERDEFTLVYQPKIDVASGELAGVEALLRWHNAELGTVPPDQFIPLAEDTGMINQIGRWVVQQAAAQARRWQLEGQPLQVAVNLSARQFQHGDVVDVIEEALAQHELEPCWLSVELTESSFLHSAEQTAETLVALRERGIGVAIDDFGTGYSSLSYIRTMSLDQLKIDRSFINNITEAERDRQLVSAMIAMSQALGLNVVAEGVETREQLEMLATLGCDQAQGYLICRSQPAEALSEWLAQYRQQPMVSGGKP